MYYDFPNQHSKPYFLDNLQHFTGIIESLVTNHKSQDGSNKVRESGGVWDRNSLHKTPILTLGALTRVVLTPTHSNKIFLNIFHGKFPL